MTDGQKSVTGSVSTAGLGLLLAVVTAAHILIAPFTKVEESFNIQAVHDLCHLGSNIASYDHLEFSGVVPRTFVGALAIAVPACPLIKLFSLIGFSKLCGLYIARLILASYSLGGLWYLRRAVSLHLGRPVANAFILVTCSQFHLLFYVGRPLPNTLALPLVAVAAAKWLNHRAVAAVCILTFTVVVVRCDLAPLLALIGLQLLASRQLSLPMAVMVGSTAAMASVLISICIDSLFWQRWLWPEGAVFWFNTAENRSSEWGTQPWHWYLTSALPRACLGAVPLGAFGIFVERRIWRISAITLLYIALYSFLPHKELRFLLPVLPLLNIPPATAVAWVWQRRRKSTIQALLMLGAASLMALSFAASCLLLYISRLNYPGGAAMLQLHRLPHLRGVEHQPVHIGVLPAMTGVTRFGEQGLPWTYSKEEDLSMNELQEKQFSHLLTASKRVPGYEVAATVLSFSKLKLFWRPEELIARLQNLQLPWQIVQTEAVFVQKTLEPLS